MHRNKVAIVIEAPICFEVVRIGGKEIEKQRLAEFQSPHEELRRLALLIREEQLVFLVAVSFGEIPCGQYSVGIIGKNSTAPHTLPGAEQCRIERQVLFRVKGIERYLHTAGERAQRNREGKPGCFFHAGSFGLALVWDRSCCHHESARERR